MKNLITLCLLAATLCLAWEHNRLSTANVAAEAKVMTLSSELESLRAELKSANNRIAQRGSPENSQASQSGPQPGPPFATKPNWIEERNRNWQSPLTSGPVAPSGPGDAGGSGKSSQRGTRPAPP